MAFRREMCDYMMQALAAKQAEDHGAKHPKLVTKEMIKYFTDKATEGQLAECKRWMEKTKMVPGNLNTILVLWCMVGHINDFKFTTLGLWPIDEEIAEDLGQ
jgi:hypothetical protein